MKNKYITGFDKLGKAIVDSSIRISTEENMQIKKLTRGEEAFMPNGNCSGNAICW